MEQKILSLFFIVSAYIEVILCAKLDSQIIVEKLEMVDTNDDGLVVAAKLGKDLTFNMNYSLLRDIEALDLAIDLFALKGKSYQPVPIKFKKSMCDVFKKEYLIFADDFKKYGKVPDSCPIKKGQYYIKDYKIDFDKLTSFGVSVNMIPWKNLKIRVKFIEGGKTIFASDIFVKIVKSAGNKKLGR